MVRHLRGRFPLSAFLIVDCLNRGQYLSGAKGGDISVAQTKHGVPIKTCPQCGYEGELLDALFFLDTAAMLIPMPILSLRKFLSRHKDQFPPLYGHYGPQRRRHRLLTADEVRQIRTTLVAGPKRSGLDDLLRRANYASQENDRGGKDFAA
jgi:hypothetical protein